ncbi:MAG: 16S rRNA (guanine(527)-N(7))-methyltransferase RsmG [Syntrophomonadaceae bacterium]|nr:16S rRNA (guanine(527)-N(7))-methyltransferase RsmG [Syntrophomonadaceae bacterium]
MKEMLERYVVMLTEANKTQNLISRQTTADEMGDHIADSLALLDFMELKGRSVLDIGSGQGFPAIPLSLAEPECSFVMVESDLKKSGFLIEIQHSLPVQNAKVIRGRVEELARKSEYRAGFDVVTCRAVAGLSTILEWGLPLLKVGGILVAWKGARIMEEIDESKVALDSMGGVISQVKEYEIAEKPRSLALIEKIKETPDRYPRRGGLAKKRPIR